MSKVAGWLDEEKTDDWRNDDQATVRAGDVSREIADDPTSIAIMRGGSDLSAQTVRLLLPRRQPREAGSAGGEEATADLMVLGTSSFDVQRSDRFFVNSELYEVIYVAPEQPSSGERVEAYCRQVQ